MHAHRSGRYDKRNEKVSTCKRWILKPEFKAKWTPYIKNAKVEQMMIVLLQVHSYSLLALENIKFGILYVFRMLFCYYPKIVKTACSKQFLFFFPFICLCVSERTLGSWHTQQMSYCQKESSSFIFLSCVRCFT